MWARIKSLFHKEEIPEPACTCNCETVGKEQPEPEPEKPKAVRMGPTQPAEITNLIVDETDERFVLISLNNGQQVLYRQTGNGNLLVTPNQKMVELLLKVLK